MPLPHTHKTSFRNVLKSYLSGTGQGISGSVAIWAALSTPVVLAGATLSVDAARVYNVDAELQAAADSLSRAGAAELDQRSDAISRSSGAILNLLSHDQKFARGNANIEIDTITYFDEIPENDYANIPESNRTNSSGEARYVEVSLKPRQISTIFPSSFLQTLTDTTLSAKAVAGMDQVVCGTAPVFICNPMEGEATNIYEAMETKEFRRKQIKFKTPNNVSDPYGSGSFGWLDPFGGNSGASKLADAVAIDISPACFSQSKGVVLRTGNIASMRDGVNTRFDIYEGSFKQKKNDPRYAPAANVVKGWAPVKSNKTCTEAPSSAALGLPRDDCFSSDSCDSSRIGTGDWDFSTYMAVNHPGFTRITIESVTYRQGYNGKFSPSEPPSRYAMYRWEIDNNCVPGAQTYGNHAVTAEEGLPQCHTSGPSTTVKDRRIITAAVLNCAKIEADSPNGMFKQKDPLPVETFVKVFLTEPMGKGQQNVLYGEIIGPVVKGQDGEANDLVAVRR
ncbi:MAG: Tad domain-containing protein [Litorimonas sp.]